jgi:hypothetical protein
MTTQMSKRCRCVQREAEGGAVGSVVATISRSLLDVDERSAGGLSEELRSGLSGKGVPPWGRAIVPVEEAVRQG